jgi:iron complex outermembrane receptor protein
LESQNDNRWIPLASTEEHRNHFDDAAIPACPKSYRSRFIPTVLLALNGLMLAGTACATEIDDLSLDDLLNTKITTASKFSQRISESPSSAVVIRGEEIRSHGWRNLSEALISVRGFEVSRGTDYYYLGSRGFTQPGDFNSRILLLIDGIPSNDGIYDQAMIGPEFPIDMSLIERIEVVPGAGSALYGANAYLAVVNVITWHSDSAGNNITLGTGSAGLARGHATTSGKDEDGRHWLISASLERTTGEDRFFPQWAGIGGSDGWARDMDGERLHRMFLRVGGEEWNLQLLHGRRQKLISGGQYASDFDIPAAVADSTTQMGLRFQRPLANSWILEGQAYAGEYHYHGLYSYSAQGVGDNARSGWVGGSTQLTGRPWENQTWILGASIRDDYKRVQENIGGLVKSKRLTTSFYAQDDIRINGAVILNIGGRFDHYTLGSRQFSPRVGLVINLPAATVLKLVAGKAFRPPNAYELDYAYPGTQLAGGMLKPERISTSEIALEQAIGVNGRWSASLYRNRFTDLIGVSTNFSTGMQQIKNLGNAYIEGLELGARYRFASGFDVRGSLSWQSSEDADGAPLPNSARRLAKFLAIIPIGTYELGWETYYNGRRRDVFGAEVGGQTLSHAALSGRFSRDVRWQLRVSNLFDRRIATVVGGEYSLGTAGNVPSITDYGRQLQFNLTADF